MNHDFDALVIGGGLAGCAMSAELHSRGRSVAMIDEAHLSACSRVAMGVVNPLVLRSLNPQEQIREGSDELDFFFHAEHRYGALLEARSVIQVFADAQDRAHWEERWQTGENPWLAAPSDAGLPEPWQSWNFHHPYGWARIRQSGLLNTRAFIAREQANLNSRGHLFNHALADHEIHPTADGIVCGRWSARTAIFCEGWRTILSPFWQKVSLKPAKGEMIGVELGGPAYHDHPALDFEIGSGFSDGEHDQGIPILHRDIHVLARSIDARRLVAVGATHTWDDISETRSEQAKAELLFKLERMHDGPMQTVDQQCGIRPAARDRRPIIGRHPEIPHMAILNGLGTRGILLAPGLAWLLANALDGDDCIPAIWNVNRFWSLR